MTCDARVRSLPEAKCLAGQGLLIALVAVPLLPGTPALAQQAGYGQTFGTTPMERQIYDGGSGRPNGGTILDTTNPLDLMNKIRRSTAMDDATPPASAIDQALQQLEAQSAPPPRPEPASGATTTGLSSAAAAPAQSPAGTGAASTGVSAVGRPVATTPVWTSPATPSTTSPAPSGAMSKPPAL